MIKVLVAIFKEVLPVLLFDTTSCLPYYCKNSTLSLREVSKYGVFSGPYFHVFGLNVEIYSVNLRIQSEYRNVRTRKTPHLDTFHAVYR